MREAIATWARPCRADRRCRRGDARQPTRARSQRACRSNSCSPIRAIRGAISPTPSSTSWPLRSASAASSSRSWCARARRADNFEIIAGERRWRAAQRAGLHDVPIVVDRGDRRRSARARHHRERAAHRSQSARRGEGLSAARRASSITRQDDIAQDRRQEPQPCRQHDAAAEAVRRR